MIQLLVRATDVPVVLGQNPVLPGAAQYVPSVVIAGMLLTAAFLQWLVRTSGPDRYAAHGDTGFSAGRQASHPVPPGSRYRPSARIRSGGWRQATWSRPRSLRPVLAGRAGAVIFAALAGLTIAAALFFEAVAGLVVSVVFAALAVPGGLAACGAIARKPRRAERTQPYLGKLAHSGRLITTAPTPKLAATLTGAAIDFGFDIACLLLLDEDGERFTVCAAVGLGDDIVGTTVYASEGVLGIEPAARLARCVIVADDYPASPFSNSNLFTEVRSALAAPLSVGGQPIGVLAAAKRSTGIFATEQIEAFEVLALQGGLGFETVARRRAALEAAVL